MNILIVGFGSIGKRHYQNLLKLGYKNIKVYDPSGTTFAGFEEVQRIIRLSVKTAEEFEVVLICSPNNLHIKQAIICAKAGCNIFVEKPLACSNNGLKNLLEICKERKLITMVGCNMRFHPCIRYIKKTIDKKLLGQIYLIKHEFGSYLPSWRPGQDYSKNFAAKKEMGGGIILDDIHEFDLLFWLNDYAKIEKASFIYDKISNLKIETEDICLASFEFDNKVFGLVTCDYLQQRYSRNCKIVGEKGTLFWDFLENIVWLKSDKDKKIYSAKNFLSNQMYISELEYFLTCIKKGKDTFNNISIAANTLSNILDNI